MGEANDKEKEGRLDYDKRKPWNTSKELLLRIVSQKTSWDKLAGKAFKFSRIHLSGASFASTDKRY